MIAGLFKEVFETKGAGRKDAISGMRWLSKALEQFTAKLPEQQMENLQRLACYDIATILKGECSRALAAVDLQSRKAGKKASPDGEDDDSEDTEKAGLMPPLLP